MDVHRKNMEKPITVPNGASRLFDLIAPSSADLLPAFFCAMGNTMVTNTLDNAVKLAYVGDRAVYRMVTLDGNLIDTSGAMSGGGKQVKSGSMRLSGASSKSSAKHAMGAAGHTEITAEQLKALEQRVQSLQTQLNDLRSKKIGLEREIKELKVTVKQLEVEVFLCLLSASVIPLINAM